MSENKEKDYSAARPPASEEPTEMHLLCWDAHLSDTDWLPYNDRSKASCIRQLA
jgi:hypothetical protein